MTVSTADYLEGHAPDVHDAAATASRIAIAVAECLETETTVYHFFDGSALRVQGLDYRAVSNTDHEES